MTSIRNDLSSRLTQLAKENVAQNKNMAEQVRRLNLKQEASIKLNRGASTLETRIPNKVDANGGVSLEISQAGRNSLSRTTPQTETLSNDFSKEFSKELKENISKASQGLSNNSSIQEDADAFMNKMVEMSSRVLKQADTAKLAQANQTPDAVLQLLR